MKSAEATGIQNSKKSSTAAGMNSEALIKCIAPSFAGSVDDHYGEELEGCDIEKMAWIDSVFRRSSHFTNRYDADGRYFILPLEWARGACERSDLVLAFEYNGRTDQDRHLGEDKDLSDCLERESTLRDVVGSLVAALLVVLLAVVLALFRARVRTAAGRVCALLCCRSATTTTEQQPRQISCDPRPAAIEMRQASTAGSARLGARTATTRESTEGYNIVHNSSTSERARRLSSSSSGLGRLAGPRQPTAPPATLAVAGPDAAAAARGLPPPPPTFKIPDYWPSFSSPPPH